MRRYILYVAVFCLPVLLAFMPVDKWISFESKEWGFKLAFPKTPQETKNSVDTEIGKVDINFFTCDMYETDSMVYMALTSTYPADKIHSDKKDIIASVFRNAIDGGVNNVKGKLLSEENISFQQYPGRAFTISFRDGEAFISARAYLVKNTMYMMQAITVKRKEHDPAIARFLGSFSLL